MVCVLRHGEHVQDACRYGTDTRIVVIHAVAVVALAAQLVDAALHVEADPVVLDDLVDKLFVAGSGSHEQAGLAGDLHVDVQSAVDGLVVFFDAVGIRCHALALLVGEGSTSGIACATESNDTHVQELPGNLHRGGLGAGGGHLLCGMVCPSGGEFVKLGDGRFPGLGIVHSLGDGVLYLIGALYETR